MPLDDPRIQVLHADCNAVDLEPESYDALFCDPPYGLTFMGNDWDKVVPPAATWRHLAKALKPGAYLVIFGGTRTFHRLAVALEDAGLEIRDTLCWLYASGYPKSKACLKPAWEPIILARKPSKDKIQPLNIDACRIGEFGFPKSKEAIEVARQNKSKNALGNGLNAVGEVSAAPGWGATPTPGGRWPANLLLDEPAAQLLDQASGTSKSRPFKEHNPGKATTLSLTKRTAGGYTDSGGASRFFWVAKANKKDRNLGLPPDQSNPHPTVKPTKLNEYLAKLILPAIASPRLLVPFSGSGSEMIGAKQAGWTNITGIELDIDYVNLSKTRLGVT